MCMNVVRLYKVPIAKNYSDGFLLVFKKCQWYFPQEIKYHWLLYGKASLRQIRALWLVLSWSAIDDFVNQQESANTKKKTATDMNTLLRFMEANGMKNELEHLFSNFF